MEMPKELHDRLHVPKMVCKRQLYSCHQTGIFKAAFEDDIEAVTEFIEKETHLNIRNWRGDTPLNCAIRGKADNTIDWLLENKASPEFGGWLYEPPIVAATAINNESAVETLLRKEIDVDGVDERGWTAVLVAAKAGFYSLTKRLINFGADLSLRSKQGDSAAYWVAKHNWEDIYERITQESNFKYLFQDAMEFAEEQDDETLPALLKNKDQNVNTRRPPGSPEGPPAKKHCQ